MANEVMNLIHLQGELVCNFMERGVSPTKAQELAGEAIHLFTQSLVMKTEYREAYDQLDNGDMV